MSSDITVLSHDYDRREVLRVKLYKHLIILQNMQIYHLPKLRDKTVKVISNINMTEVHL